MRRVVDLNLTGAMLCAREALPGMLELGRGLIVNVGSDLSRRYNPGMAAYTAEGRERRPDLGQVADEPAGALVLG